VANVWPFQGVCRVTEVCRDRSLSPSGGVSWPRCVVWPLQEVCRDRGVPPSGGVPRSTCAKSEVCQVRGVPSPRCAKSEVCQVRGVPSPRCAMVVPCAPWCAESEVCHGRVVRALKGGVPWSRCAKSVCLVTDGRCALAEVSRVCGDRWPMCLGPFGKFPVCLVTDGRCVLTEVSCVCGASSDQVQSAASGTSASGVQRTTHARGACRVLASRARYQIALGLRARPASGGSTASVRTPDATRDGHCASAACGRIATRAATRAATIFSSPPPPPRR